MKVSPGKASHGRFMHRRYNVYDVMYEATSPPFKLRIYALFDWFRAIYQKISPVKRLLVDTIKLAPATFVVYMVTTIWGGVYWAINLYLLSTLFDRLGTSLIDGALSPEVYWFLATSCLCCAMINIHVDRLHARSLELLTKRFRAYFIPRLIRASLRVDILSIQDLYSVFPVQGRFGSEFPGGLFLSRLSQIIERNLDLTFQVSILLYAISRKRSPEREILSCFCIVRGFVWWLAPSGGIGNSAYIYWPNNRHFQRMKTLFGLAFSTQYRADLVLNGIANSIEAEYNKSAEWLGNVEVLEPTPWRTDLLRDWYWDLLMDLTLDYPLAIYALIFSTHLSPSTISSMMLLQQLTKSVSLSIGRYTQETPSLLEVCSHAKRFYEGIDYNSHLFQGTEPFPRLIDDGCYNSGMKITFRHVSLLYPGADHRALCDVSFDVLPGELVLVVGTNGSGKSSLFKLLARLFDPTVGEILIDDLPLVRYDVDQLRAAMVFQSQTPVVYPVSIRGNIAFDVVDKSDNVDVEEAARMGECAEWIARLSEGHDTLLEPSFDIGQGWEDGTYGYPSEALMEELKRHRGHPASISGGEKQRLATARTFMRIDNQAKTRLVVMDEATSSLDPLSERSILSNLHSLRTGKTIILVTHRFHHLAHLADRILCMKDGSVVEVGTHVQLVNGNGEYAALYNAQTERSV